MRSEDVQTETRRGATIAVGRLHPYFVHIAYVSIGVGVRVGVRVRVSVRVSVSIDIQVSVRVTRQTLRSGIDNHP